MMSGQVPTATGCESARRNRARSRSSERGLITLAQGPSYPATMRVRQRVYLKVTSAALSPHAISNLVGLEPTESAAMGSRDPVLVLPRFHMWSYASGVDEAATLEDHLGPLVSVLLEHTAGFKAASDHGETWTELQVVRYFKDGGEDFDESTYGLDPDSSLVRLGGQHPLLGWHLEPDVLRLLSSCGMALDVDEYG